MEGKLASSKVTPAAREALDEFVEAEARRRKRVFRRYLVLLVVPILAAGIAVAWGASEREAIAPAVREAILPDVERQVTASLRPQVDAIVAERAEPVVSRLVAAEVAPAFRRMQGAEGLRDEIGSLQQTVTRLDRRVAQFESVTPQIRELPESIGVVRGSAARAAELAGRNDKRLAEMERRLESMEKQVMVLRNEMDLVRRRMQIAPDDRRPVNRRPQ